MFKPKRGKSTILYIEERPLIFMAAASGEYYQQPFLILLSASVCGSHHFSVVKSFVGVFLKPTHKGFWNEFIWCVL